ncbi:MAG: hypothetical protein OEU93_06935, partial [Rubrivivax sp.]|nr:hypothetical protein [Rubrivivax sp.]
MTAITVWRRHANAWILGLAAMVGLGLPTAWAADKPRIERAADLPRFGYRIDGKLEDLVRSPDRFAAFAAQVRRDTLSVLEGYDIPDKATRKDLVGLLAMLDYLGGDYAKALARSEEVRALEDKPADKLLSGMRLRAMSQAASRHGPQG